MSESNLFGGSVSGTAQLLAKAQERSRRRKREAGVQSIPMSFRAGLSGVSSAGTEQSSDLKYSFG